MGFFDFKPTFFLIRYEGGLPDLKAGTDVRIDFNGYQFSISTVSLFSNKISFAFSAEQIIEVSLEQQKYRSAGGAATGAIVGGLLTGGIGLLAGAAMGGKRRTENYLTLVVEHKGREYEIHFKPGRTTQQVYGELVTLSSKAIKAKPVIPQVKVETDIVTELEKLHSLAEKGILTKEEFEKLKGRLINSTTEIPIEKISPTPLTIAKPIEKPKTVLTGRWKGYSKKDLDKMFLEGKINYSEFKDAISQL